MMMTIQRRRERINRQINKRLRALMAACKTLGSSFSDNLTVNPTHLRESRHSEVTYDETDPVVKIDDGIWSSERSRRIRDDVEAALSDIMLLGTQEQVRLAQRVVNELLAGRPVHTPELVISLRDFIRDALDLDLISSDLALPRQGPTRPSSVGGRGKNDRSKDNATQSRAQAQGGGMGGQGSGMGISGNDNNDDTPPTKSR